MTVSKNGNGRWPERWQEQQPMSEFYKAHRPKKPHMWKTWHLLETCKVIPHPKELATTYDTTEAAIDHIFNDFREAGGKLERQGNGRGYTVTMPKVKKLAPATMPQLELVTAAPPVVEPEPASQIALQDIYDMQRETRDAVREMCDLQRETRDAVLKLCDLQRDAWS